MAGFTQEELSGIRNRYQQQQRVAQRPTAPVKKKGSAWSMLPSALAAAASIIPGVGTVAATGLGAGGEFLRQKLNHEDTDLGAIGREAALSAVPGGLGKAASFIKGARTARNAVKVADFSSDASQVSKAVTSTAKSTPIVRANQTAAGRQYAKAFGDIPAKLSNHLKLPQTAQELHDYGVRGSLDDISNVSKTVMSKLGNAVTSAADDVNGYIKTGDIEGVLNNSLKGVNISKGDKQALFELVTDASSKGPLPGYIHPNDALDLVRKLEKRGHARINSGKNIFNPDDNKVDFGHAHLMAANELEDSLYSAIKNKGSLEKYASPETVKELNSVAKGLGDKFATAAKSNDTEAVRSLMAPFVRGNHLVDIANDTDNTAFKNLSRGIVRGGGGGPLSLATDGVRALAAPIIERNSAKIATNSAAAIDGSKGIIRNATDAIANKASNSKLVRYGVRGLLPQEAVRGVADAVTQPVDAAPDPNALLQEGAPQDPSSSVDNSALEDPTAVDPSSEQVPGISRENLMAAIAADPKNTDTYLSIYKLFADEDATRQKGSALNATQAKSLQQLQGAQSSLDELQSAFAEAGGAHGKVGGALANLLSRSPIATNSGVATYNDIGKSLATQLTRVLGNTGSLSDTDLAQIGNMIPKITDTEETASAKIRHLQSMVQNAQASLAYTTDGQEEL